MRAANENWPKNETFVMNVINRSKAWATNAAAIPRIAAIPQIFRTRESIEVVLRGNVSRFKNYVERRGNRKPINRG